MSHFAKVVDGVVEQVIVAEQDFIDTLPDKDSWVQTSYGTHGGVHYDMSIPPVASDRVPSTDGKQPLRKNFARVGGIYDPVRDAFYEAQPYPSWSLDEDTCYWMPPVPKPDPSVQWYWDEDTLSWTRG